MSVREVYPGGAGNDSYVELQMWAAGQEFVANHHLVAYNASGTVNDDFKLPSNVAVGANQATILIADTEYPVVFDERPLPDASDSNLNLSPAGGAVCWTEGSPPDCVAWGNFTGPFPAHLPTLQAGNPASPSGVSAGKALRRSIAAGCPTLLDPPPTDDSDDSATDFSEQAPNPRDNASPIVESECPALPNTAIKDPKPANPTNSTAASFAYEAIPATGASFECSLDGIPFSSCEASGASYAGLGEGAHTFAVRAVNGSGSDPTPATYGWKIDLTPPSVTLDEPIPPSPNSGTSLTFRFHASETGAAFACLLEGPTASPLSPCAGSGTTYAGLSSGSYTFKVQATDPAGNLGAATPLPFTVDTSLADTTPPETTITAKPADPSESAAAGFVYSSSEPGSSFECALDGGPFAGCPPAGISYAGLGPGPHSFQVRATDASGNRDQSPAGYSWSIALLLGPPGPLTQAGTTPSAPETRLTRKPPARTRDRTPTFRFRASIAGATFRCRLDRALPRLCGSPFTTRTLPFGRHRLEVTAIVAGVADPTPAACSFIVSMRKPKRGGG